MTQRSPVLSKSPFLPERNRSRLDEEQGSAPLRPQRRENAPEQPIRRCDAWLLSLQPIRGELMTRGGDFQLQWQSRPTRGGEQRKQKAEDANREYERAQCRRNIQQNQLTRLIGTHECAVEGSCAPRWTPRRFGCGKSNSMRSDSTRAFRDKRAAYLRPDSRLRISPRDSRCWRKM